jgi:hypothetical protein
MVVIINTEELNSHLLTLSAEKNLPSGGRQAVIPGNFYVGLCPNPRFFSAESVKNLVLITVFLYLHLHLILVF